MWQAAVADRPGRSHCDLILAAPASTPSASSTPDACAPVDFGILMDGTNTPGLLDAEDLLSARPDGP
jgi:hypothetical protein